MATLSDLASERVQPEVPAWIEALESSRGFVPGDGLFLAAAPDPNAGTPPESEPDALDEAFKNGEAAGRAEAMAQLATSEKNAGNLALSFKALDEVASLALQQRLAETVAGLCEQIIAPHLADREALAERCVKAVSALNEAPGKCRLHLNPDDIALLDPAFSEAWHISADGTLERGALRLEGPEGLVCDGPDQWRRAIVAALLP